MRHGPVLAILLLAACDTKAPAPSGGDGTAIAAAERQAVGDTDAALRDAATAQTSGTKGADDRSSR